MTASKGFLPFNSDDSDIWFKHSLTSLPVASDPLIPYGFVRSENAGGGLASSPPLFNANGMLASDGTSDVCLEFSTPTGNPGITGGLIDPWQCSFEIETPWPYRNDATVQSAGYNPASDEVPLSGFQSVADVWQLWRKEISGNLSFFVASTTQIRDYTGIESPRRLFLNAATQANPIVCTANNHGLTDGQLITFQGITDMVELNGNYYLVNNATTNTFELTDSEGNNIDSTLFTALTAPDTGNIIVITDGQPDSSKFQHHSRFITGTGQPALHSYKMPSGHLRLNAGISAEDRRYIIFGVNDVPMFSMFMEDPAEGAPFATLYVGSNRSIASSFTASHRIKNLIIAKKAVYFHD